MRLGLLMTLGVMFTASGCEGRPAPAISVGSRVLVGAADPTAGDTGDVGQEGVDAGTGTVTSPVSSAGTTGIVDAGATLRTTTTLNMRTGPGTSNSVRLVLAEGSDTIAVSGTPENGWYNISFNGVAGWSSGKYLELVKERDPNEPPSTRDTAIARAKAGVGFSYWWGHGRWIPNGATSSNIGTCSGSCPSCSHTGQYGADCSGYVAKIWEVPSNNTDPENDSHPYSTVTFNGSNSQWSTIDRSAVKPADSLVYNQNGAGHIFLYESGDGWGSMWAYEARGCSYGIVHNLRTAGSAFKAIVRTGY